MCNKSDAIGRKATELLHAMKHTPVIRWRTTRSVGTVALVIGALLVCAGIACACNVPVFRYALERWHPDPYRVTLFHQGPLTEAQQAHIRTSEQPPSKADSNVTFRLVEVDTIADDTDRALFAAQSSPQLPWLVVQYPRDLRIEKSIWSGPLAGDVVDRLTTSPLRTELIHRLADGQTAVWLLLECGQAHKDDAAAVQLADELKQLSQRLQLPELTSAPEDALLSTAPLKVTFSLLRVPRNVATEQPLVEMLLGSEPDLIEFDEPMIFPVFGRGRALLPLVGAGITADNVHESAAFLVGACSCEVKDLNPGFDLLLAADWDFLLFKGAPPTEILTKRSSGKPELVAIPSGTHPAQPESEPTESGSVSSIGPTYVAGVALVGLLLAVVMMAVKRFS